MSNIRLFFPESLSINLTGKLNTSQSHYINKVMRVKANEVFSLFNGSGEWEAKTLDISKNIVKYTTIYLLVASLTSTTNDAFYKIFHFFVNAPENSNITVNISKRPKSIKKEAKIFAGVPMLAQFEEGPISPKPGPILPIADADTANELVKSSPNHANRIPAKTKINI